MDIETRASMVAARAVIAGILSLLSDRARDALESDIKGAIDAVPVSDSVPEQDREMLKHRVLQEIEGYFATASELSLPDPSD